jgi:cell division protein FtsB
MLTLSLQTHLVMHVSVSRFGYGIVFILIAGYALFALQGPKGIPALLEKRRQIEAAEKHNANLAQENERLREHIHRLGDSPAEQEMEIRQRLKLVHPGEKVYILGK